MEKLKELAAEDFQLVETLIAIYTEQAPESLTEMRRLTEDQDGPALKAEAHTMKGVSLNLGLEDIALMCKQIEDLALAEEWEKIPTCLDRLHYDVQTALQEMQELSASFR